MPVFGYIPVCFVALNEPYVFGSNCSKICVSYFLPFYYVLFVRLTTSRRLDFIAVFVGFRCTSYTSFSSCIKYIFLCRFNCLSPIFIGVLVITFVVKYSLTFLLCRFNCHFLRFARRLGYYVHLMRSFNYVLFICSFYYVHFIRTSRFLDSKIYVLIFSF